MRDITYFIYEIFKDWKGCGVIMGLYMLIHIPLELLIRSIGWNDIITTPIWGAAGILLFSWLNKSGYKIELDKKKYDRWREIVRSLGASREQKERCAKKILNSKDLNMYGLHDIVYNLPANSDIHNEALDKFNLTKSVSHQRRN